MSQNSPIQVLIAGTGGKNSTSSAIMPIDYATKIPDYSTIAIFKPDTDSENNYAISTCKPDSITAEQSTPVIVSAKKASSASADLPIKQTEQKKQSCKVFTSINSQFTNSRTGPPMILRNLSLYEFLRQMILKILGKPTSRTFNLPEISCLSILQV